MATRWHATAYPGVRFREHASRMHLSQRDRYYTIRCKWQGKDVERGLGWASAGMSPEKAEAALQGLRAALQHQLQELAPTHKDMPAPLFSFFWEHEYLPYIIKKKAASSVALEQGMYANWLKPTLGSLPLNQLTSDRLDSLAADMQEANRSPRTIRYCLSIVSQMWNLARSGPFELPENPCLHVSDIVAAQTPLRLPSQNELWTILQTLLQRNKDLHDASRLSLFCGLSPGELFRLSWAEISLARGTLHVKGVKNGRGRTVYLPKPISELLAQRHWESFSRMGGMHITDYLFSRKADLKYEWFSRAFDRIALEENWNKKGAPRHERITFISFRHVYAVWLISGGMALPVVAELMGHKTTSLLQQYEHLAPSPGALSRAVLDKQWTSMAHEV